MRTEEIREDTRVQQKKIEYIKKDEDWNTMRKRKRAGGGGRTWQRKRVRKRRRKRKRMRREEMRRKHRGESNIVVGARTRGNLYKYTRITEKIR